MNEEAVGVLIKHIPGHAMLTNKIQQTGKNRNKKTALFVNLT